MRSDIFAEAWVTISRLLVKREIDYHEKPCIHIIYDMLIY